MRHRLVIGNWKMNGDTTMIRDLLISIKRKLSAIDLETVVLPPYVYLPLAGELLQDCTVGLGAQDLSCHTQGAYTGEVSAAMLADIGAQYVLVGHCERRQHHHESNKLVAEKLLKALEYELTPVLCVGETLEQRHAGQTEAIIHTQIQAVLDRIDSLTPLQHSIIAYEPVWAIGTNVSAAPQDVQAVHLFIRNLIAERSSKLAKTIRIIYGGSVKPDNAKDLFSLADVDGGLVGGASLKSDDFIDICTAAAAT